MDVVTGVELECSYGAGDGWTRSGVASMPKERSGGPRLDRSCDWEKYGYDIGAQVPHPHCHRYVQRIVTHQMCLVLWTWRKLADETNAKNAPKIC